MPEKKLVPSMKKGHYFAVSVAEWRCSIDVEDLVATMKRGGYQFSLIYVPLPISAHYEISFYAPVVEGCIVLTDYNFEGEEV